MDNVLLKAYDGTMVSVPRDKKDEYLATQIKIANYLKEGKSITEIKEILKGDKHE